MRTLERASLHFVMLHKDADTRTSVPTSGCSLLYKLVDGHNNEHQKQHPNVGTLVRASANQHAPINHTHCRDARCVFDDNGPQDGAPPKRTATRKSYWVECGWNVGLDVSSHTTFTTI